MSDCEKAKIVGYIEQSQEQITLINNFKQLEVDVVKQFDFFLKQPDFITHPAFDSRWMSIAKTHIQQGFMAAVRSVARPLGD